MHSHALMMHTQLQITRMRYRAFLSISKQDSGVGEEDRGGGAEGTGEGVEHSRNGWASGGGELLYTALEITDIKMLGDRLFTLLKTNERSTRSPCPGGFCG